MYIHSGNLNLKSYVSDIKSAWASYGSASASAWTKIDFVSQFFKFISTHHLSRSWDDSSFGAFFKTSSATVDGNYVYTLPIATFSSAYGEFTIQNASTWKYDTSIYNWNSYISKNLFAKFWTFFEIPDGKFSEIAWARSITDAYPYINYGSYADYYSGYYDYGYQVPSPNNSITPSSTTKYVIAPQEFIGYYYTNDPDEWGTSKWASCDYTAETFPINIDFVGIGTAEGNDATIVSSLYSAFSNAYGSSVEKTYKESWTTQNQFLIDASNNLLSDINDAAIFNSASQYNGYNNSGVSYVNPWNVDSTISGYDGFAVRCTSNSSDPIITKNTYGVGINIPSGNPNAYKLIPFFVISSLPFGWQTSSAGSVYRNYAALTFVMPCCIVQHPVSAQNSTNNLAIVPLSANTGIISQGNLNISEPSETATGTYGINKNYFPTASDISPIASDYVSYKNKWSSIFSYTSGTPAVWFNTSGLPIVKRTGNLPSPNEFFTYDTSITITSNGNWSAGTSYEVNSISMPMGDWSIDENPTSSVRHYGFKSTALKTGLKFGDYYIFPQTTIQTPNINTGLITQQKSNITTEILWKGISNTNYTNENIPAYYMPSSPSTYVNWWRIDISSLTSNLEVKVVSQTTAAAIVAARNSGNSANLLNAFRTANNDLPGDAVGTWGSNYNDYNGVRDIYCVDAEESKLSAYISMGDLNTSMGINTNNTSLYVYSSQNSTSSDITKVLAVMAQNGNNTVVELLPLNVKAASITYDTNSGNISESPDYAMIELSGANTTASFTATYKHPSISENSYTINLYKDCTYNATNQTYTFTNSITNGNISPTLTPSSLSIAANTDSGTSTITVTVKENPYKTPIYKVIRYKASSNSSTDGFSDYGIIIKQNPAHLDLEYNDQEHGDPTEVSAQPVNYGISLLAEAEWKYSFTLKNSSIDKNDNISSSSSYLNLSGTTYNQTSSQTGFANIKTGYVKIPYSSNVHNTTTYVLKVWFVNNTDNYVEKEFKQVKGYLNCTVQSGSVIGPTGGTVGLLIESNSGFWQCYLDNETTPTDQNTGSTPVYSKTINRTIDGTSGTSISEHTFYTYANRKAATQTDGVSYSYVKTTTQISQQGQAETYTFEIRTKDQNNTFVQVSNISFDKSGKNNYTGSSGATIRILNTGNASTSYTLSRSTASQFIVVTFPSSTTVSPGSYVDFNISVPATPTDEDRFETWTIQAAEGGYTQQLVISQQAGERNAVFRLVGATTLSKVDTQDSNNLTRSIVVENKGSIQSKYHIELYNPYEYTEGYELSLTSGEADVSVNAGGTYTYNFKFSNNNTTERKTGFYVTVRDINAFNISQTFYFSQECFPDPFFIPSTTFTDSGCSGRVLNTNEYVNPLVNFRTNISNGTMDSLSKGNLLYEITSNKPSYLSISNLSGTSSKYFTWSTAQNITTEPVELEIYIDCFYDETKVNSYKYNKSNPYRRTIQLVLNTEITPNLYISSEGDNYITHTSGNRNTYTYLFGPNTGTRMFGITDQTDSKNSWTAIQTTSGNSYSYAIVNPSVNSSYSTVSISTPNKLVDNISTYYGLSKYRITATSNTGISPTGSRCDTASNTSTSGYLDISVYRFPLPSLKVYGNGDTSHELSNDDCTFNFDNNNSFYITFDDTNAISLSQFSDTRTEYYYEIDNNLFELSYDNEINRLYINTPKNTSVSKSIVGTLSIYYNYPSTVPDHTNDLVKKYTFTVLPANIPVINLTPSRTSYTFNYDGSPTENFGIVPNSEGYYPITLSSASSLPLTWNFEKEEFGTNGSEFKFVRTAYGIQFAVPVNTDINTYKECNLTISYWYTADGTKESLQTKYLTFSVAPAPELKIIPDTSVQYAKGYNNDSDFNSIDISITATNGDQISEKTPVEWKIEHITEFGTTGSEFNFRKVGNQIQINTVPDNMSINNTKSATVVAKAYYRGQENTYSINGIYEYIVNPMNRLSIQEVSINMIPNSYTKNYHSGDTNMNAFYIDDPTGNTTEGIRYIAYKIVDSSGNNLTNSDAVIIKTNKSETGTNGNEYRITGTDITTDINGDPIYIITVRIPSYNVSTTYQKECDITIEASYRNGDSNYSETNIKHYNVDIAPKFYIEFVADPSILNNYTYKGIRRNEDTNTITPKFVLKDVNTNAVLNNISNTRINQFLMWTFSTEETNTTGREFTVLHNPDIQEISTTLPGGYVYNAQNANNWYTVKAPENFITNKDKTCVVTLTAKYLNNNDDFVINYECRYVVSAAGKLVLSFTDPRDAQFDWKYDLTTNTVVPLNGENNDIEIGLAENIPNGEVFNIYDDTDYIAWSFEKTEINTNGNEFSVSKNGVDGLTIDTANLPKNTSTSNAKICNITFKAWYRAGDPNDFATLTGVYRVIPASGFTTEIDPRSFTFDPDGQGLTDLSTYIKIKDASGNYIHDGIADISINIVPEYVNSVESEWNYTAVPDLDDTNDVYYWINLISYPTNLTTSSKELKLNITCGYNNGSYSITDVITYKVLPSGFPEIKFIDVSTMVQSDTLTLEFGPDTSTQNVYLITNKRNDLLKANTWYYYNRAVTPPEKSNVSGQLDLYVGDKIVGYMSRGYDRFVEQAVDNSDQTVWLSEFAVTLYDSENIINDTEFSVYLIGDNVIGDSPFITLIIKQQKASTEYKPTIKTASIFPDPSNSKFYNMGFPYYWSNKDEINDYWDSKCPYYQCTETDINGHEQIYQFNYVKYNPTVAEIVPESEGIEIQRVSDIRPVDINYHQRKDSDFPYITVDPNLRSNGNNVIQRFNVSLSYTNALFGFAVTDPPTVYKFRAYTTVRYRLGSSDPDKWHEEKIYGEWKQFTYLALYNKDEEFIRPYFKPMEHEKGYLTGTEIKNFINSKGVVFNRSENNIIELTNFFNNYEIVDGKIKINITNALIEHILYSEAFNKAWNYINDSDNLLKAKTAYIRNIILPNIIVNADSTVEIYENSKSSSLGISRSINNNFKQIENTGTQFEIEENQDKTLVFNGLKNKTYFFKVKVSF